MAIQDDNDSQFWDQVLQRYATAKLEVSRLTAQLEREQEESDKLRKELAREKEEKTNATTTTTNDNTTATREAIAPRATVDDENRAVDAQKLNELEAGIAQAEESYQKIAKKARQCSNATTINNLLEKAEALKSERDDMEIKKNECTNALRVAEHDLAEVRAENERLKGAEAQLAQARAENERLQAMIEKFASDPSPTPRPSGSLHSAIALQNEIERVYQPRVAALESELETLRKTNFQLQEERDHARREHELARTKLDKIKQSKTVLQDQLKGLGQITRQRRESVNSQSSARITRSQAGTHTSPQSTLSSLVIPPSISSASQAGGSNLNKPSASGALALVLPNGKTLDAIDLTLSEDDVPTPRPAFTEVAVPWLRQNELSKIPVIQPGVPLLESENAFSREFMAAKLGGSIQPLVVSVAKQGTLGKKRNITSYLCPGVEHNPWCPTTPGHHGYIFVGLGREKDWFNEPEERNVFVGLKKAGKDMRRFRYLGKYRVVRVHPLVKEEWESLSEHVRNTYAKTTKEKTNARSVSAILRAYETGELSVPCVQLQCIGFDQELYTAMVEMNASYTPKGKSSSSSSHKRALEYDADDDSARKRRTLRGLVSS
ncbi:hypothetical protein D9611_003287 [Ephemerocybe angulata]|uniref:DUF6697 domain-containing protein n=1 Tax=Ephemerocybe angulata TaxID=980116 RepID=A0A8H5C7V6_9AGAR|nr:hypothetical protein D9611_003287 [Tulosesus angulatus]